MKHDMNLSFKCIGTICDGRGNFVYVKTVISECTTYPIICNISFFPLSLFKFEMCVFTKCGRYNAVRIETGTYSKNDLIQIGTL